MLRDIEENPFRPIEFLLEIPGVRVHVVAVDVILGPEALELFGEFVDIFDQHAKMVDSAVVEALAKLIGLEFEDRHVEGAVAQEHTVSEHAVRPANFLEIERLLIELCHLLRVFRGNGDVTKLGHVNLLAYLLCYPSTLRGTAVKTRARFLPTRVSASSHGKRPKRANSGSNVPLARAKREVQVRLCGSGNSGGVHANSARSLPRR